ncbi:MAG: CYTH domain-containing protein [Spirochaetaceae bacterium]|jgi:predicted adenylyl cyclase CyaB|nr:CYTH domain-containing protein [Spirochaetaceae bacterium]
MGKSVEIELKAHVSNSADCKNRLVSLAGEGTPFFKDDAYWFVPEFIRVATAYGGGLPDSGLRVRREKAGDAGHTIVTLKRKEMRAECEVNDEQEFAVSDGAAFEELLELLGLEKQIHKRKQGWVWRYRGITAELCKVSGSVYTEPEIAESETPVPGAKSLGWFLELEILAKEDSPGTVAAAREQLLALLEQTGIGKESIESRYYSELLSCQE